MESGEIRGYRKAERNGGKENHESNKRKRTPRKSELGRGEKKRKGYRGREKDAGKEGEREKKIAKRKKESAYESKNKRLEVRV